MAESSSKSKIVTLQSSDGEKFEVEEEVAMQSQTIKNMIEDGCEVDTILIPKVTSTILAKVIEYCKNHTKGVNNVKDLKAWDAEFVKLDHNTLIDLSLAAYYLKIESLLDFTCKTIADKIKDLSPEEIRQIFHIKNDFTPDDEKAIRRENEWTNL